ncbi:MULTISPECIES: SprT family protein [unclassified Mesobacillus]|uniref:SprT family protein n=1 Tax=unclassified Mesobacillus TaxID=2675270 RepID=UPI00203D1112|nr:MULTISPECIES: SprT family protein [unclassified Mesobacillus]MCM3125648.1 SprT family protein [Mesobacillus sp. MER 33]MCM3235669.1 SprT family protein [Mesobacillus sp. MER 48]
MTDQELQNLVSKISDDYFRKPFRHKAFFNSRLRTTGGRYMLNSHNIEINKKYFEQLGEGELIGIIKHELCHYHLHLEGKGYKHRDNDFRKLLKQVDAPRFCSTLPEEKKRKSKSQKFLIYQCSKCKLDYRRKRSINTSKYVCGKCRGKLVKVKEIVVD